MHFYARWSGNPNAEARDTKAFSFGSAAHALLLGDEAFERRHIVQPWMLANNRNEEHDGIAWTKTSKTAWLDHQSERKMRVISQSQYAEIKAMKAVLQNEPLVAQGILDGDAECSIIWQDEETGLWLKARPDVMPKAGWVVDFKTTHSAKPHKIANSVWDYRYDMQLALVAEGLAALGQEVPQHFALIFQEKSAPYAVTAQRIPVSAIEIGARSIRCALRRVADCIEKDDWPGYGEAPDVWVPEWVYNRAENTEAPAWVEALEHAE